MRPVDRVTRHSGPATLRYHVSGRTFAVSSSGFWQVHPAAAPAFVAAVLRVLRPEPGEAVIDLYAGAGLFTAFLAEAVGSTGRVVGLEGDRPAVLDAATNLGDLPWAQVRAGVVSGPAVSALGRADVVVLDPPRSGAGREVMTAVMATGARAVAYVACDPAAFARDVRTARDAGWELAALEAFDSFPMTHHVECVGLLVPGGADVS